MDAQVFLKENAVKAAEVARTVEATAGALAEALEKKTGLIAEVLEKKGGLISEVIEKQGDALAGALGSKAAPIAKAVEVKADALSEVLEEKLGQARKDAMESLKGFKFGQREALLLGVAVGALAVVVIVRRMDRKAAAERLRMAGARAGESAQKIGARMSETAQELGTRVSPAVATLTSKAGEIAGQVKEEVSTRAGGLAGQLKPSNGRHGEEAPTEYTLPTPPATEEARTQDLDEARQRLSAESGDATRAAEAALPEPPAAEAETAPTEASASEEAPAGERDQAGQGEIKVSNGMKVVAFDGTDIGRVQEVREEVFVLDRPRGADLLVPMDQVARIEGTVVYLRIEVGQVTKMGWEKADPQ